MLNWRRTSEHTHKIPAVCNHNVLVMEGVGRIVVVFLLNFLWAKKGTPYNLQRVNDSNFVHTHPSAKVGGNIAALARSCD